MPAAVPDSPIHPAAVRPAKTRVATGLATLVFAGLLLLSVFGQARAHAAGQQPWQIESGIEREFSDVRTGLILEDPDAGTFETEGLVTGPAAVELKASAPGQFRQLNSALDRARAASIARDQVALGSAQGEAIAALRFGAYRTALAMTEANRPERAKAWLQVRDFRPTTRYSRPAVEATDALNSLAEGDMTPEEAATLVDKDLLDTYQARVRIGLEAAATAGKNGYAPRFAEQVALTHGYWQIIRHRYMEDRGKAELAATDRDFDEVLAAGTAGNLPAFTKASKQITADLEGFVAAPLTIEDQVRRANQFTRFLDLVPIEYDRGVSDGRVNLDFEVQEAVAFADGAEQSFADLSSELYKTDPEGTHRITAQLDELQKDLADTAAKKTVTPNEEIDRLHDLISDETDAAFPDEWKESSDDADYDLVEISLNQMLTAVSAHAYDQAEQNRLSAYAFFEFGPEIKLKAFDPGLSAEIEGLFWYGAEGEDGLATLISKKAETPEFQSTMAAMDVALAESRKKTGEGVSKGTAVTNAALIVFREGLEAILIIAAITASMVGVRRQLRKAVYTGALLAIPASVVAYVLAVMALGSFAKYGEKVEAVVGVFAIGVLLLVLNWFFHKVYWTEWIASHRRRSKEVIGAMGAGAGAGAATVFGLYLLGFESVFREGMETVLFLQALQLSSGTGVVLTGIALGAVGISVIGLLTFKLESKLPYKKMLIVTGMLIALVLFTMVGTTVRTLQGVGWFPIHTIDVEIPLWMGNWLGIFPTVETIGAQLLAVSFVVGSYWAAGWVSKRKLAKSRAEWEREQALKAPEKELQTVS